MAEPTDGRRSLRVRTTRLEAFSDGVFAIAITLLVLEIAVPDETPDGLLAAVGDLWPSFLAYVISFATIGALWVAHSAMTHYLDRADRTLLRSNLLFLMVVAFLPFPTGLLAEHITGTDDARVAVTLYGASLLAASLLLSATWRTAVRSGLVAATADESDVALLTRRLTPGLAGYAVAIGVGWFLPVVAVLGYLALAVFLLVPTR